MYSWTLGHLRGPREGDSAVIGNRNVGPKANYGPLIHAVSNTPIFLFLGEAG